LANYFVYVGDRGARRGGILLNVANSVLNVVNSVLCVGDRGARRGGILYKAKEWSK
jgi:hypothetical protein